MSASVKICGLSRPDTLAAAIAGGADMVGFVFYEPSPRYLEPAHAHVLAEKVPASVAKVALVVDEDDQTLDHIVAELDPDFIQAHGRETPARVADLKTRYGKQIIKAISISTADDFGIAADFTGVADMLLFDAKPPDSMKDPLPGGNGLAFDWRLISTHKPATEFILSGGLNPDNVAAAIALTGAGVVDVSSGVETKPGVKDAHLIARFLESAKTGNIA